jgi:hypothetical protein
MPRKQGSQGDWLRQTSRVAEYPAPRCKSFSVSIRAVSDLYIVECKRQRATVFCKKDEMKVDENLMERHETQAIGDSMSRPRTATAVLETRGAFIAHPDRERDRRTVSWLSVKWRSSVLR